MKALRAPKWLSSLPGAAAPRRSAVLTLALDGLRVESGSAGEDKAQALALHLSLIHI